MHVIQLLLWLWFDSLCHSFIFVLTFLHSKGVVQVLLIDSIINFLVDPIIEIFFIWCCCCVFLTRPFILFLMYRGLKWEKFNFEFFLGFRCRVILMGFYYFVVVLSGKFNLGIQLWELLCYNCVFMLIFFCI